MVFLTLYPPRGGEISPPLEKMGYNFYVDLAKFINSWWFFKLKPLTPYGEVIFLFWNQKWFKISYQIHLIPMIYGSKIKKTLFSLVFWGKSYFFVMQLTFKNILAFLEVYNLHISSIFKKVEILLNLRQEVLKIL